MEWLGRCLTFKESSKCLSKVVVPFYIPSSSVRVPVVPRPPLVLAVFTVLPILVDVECASLWGRLLASFREFTDHSYISCGEVFKILCPFKKIRRLVLFSYWIESFIYILIWSTLLHNHYNLVAILKQRFVTNNLRYLKISRGTKEHLKNKLLNLEISSEAASSDLRPRSPHKKSCFLKGQQRWPSVN